MHVTSLSLRDFRNYERLDLKLEPGITLFYGPNAAGKTTILEALFYLATTRSPRAGTARELVRWEAQGDIGVPPFARLVCEVRRNDGPVRLEVIVQRRTDDDGQLVGASTTTVRVDRKAVRALDLVGNLRVVLFTPADLTLVTGAPSERRRYLDVTLSQLDGRYVRTLSHYNKVVQQRNSLLRSWREGRRPLRAVNDELGFWNRELALSGSYVLRERLRAVADLNVLIAQIFREITSGDHPLVATYQSTIPNITADMSDRLIGEAFEAHLERMRDDEIGRGQTLVGPHRDDLLLTVNTISIGTFGSRGQQRAVTLALKLGEAELMRQRTGDAPVLLLDDLLSELDAERRLHLLQVILRPDQQTLLTATGLGEFDAAFLERARTIRVESAQLYPS
ncbi:MAG TPA: DNA replication/repair protein RecF [Roseiflexaceae bacterium]|jgi:DNA replication and repair protein RecF|nr:DNA replication/repair protein RecF [Roseiflexaceae bacterium]